MAAPISLDVPPRDPRIALQAQLADAPAEHAEALLAVYQVLQGLHDSGVLDLMRGALGSRDEVLGVAVRAAGSAGAVRAIRNVLLLIEMLGAIDPKVLKAFTEAAPEAMAMMIEQPEKPGLWALLKDFFWNQDFRHGMAAINTMLETFGRSLTESKGKDAKAS
jgi:uncharacterized protein YjgD (DUF1641 family)